MMLSENFALKELTRSSYAVRRGIKNLPNRDQLDNLKYLCKNVLQPIRYWYNSPVIISSGFRSEELDRDYKENELKGNPAKYKPSLHTMGCAADIDMVIGKKLLEIFEFIVYNLPFTELIAEYFPQGWIHVGLVRGRDNERRIKIKTPELNYQETTLENITNLYQDKTHE